MNHGQPWLDQAVLTEFIESGLYERHLRRARKLYKSRRDCLIENLHRVFGQVEISGADSGLHIVWTLPQGCPDAAVVQQRARLRGVGVYALNSGAAYDFDGSASRQSLVMGYSSVKEKDIETAINRLGELLDDMRSEFTPVSCILATQERVTACESWTISAAHLQSLPEPSKATLG